jgi:predicted PurR-regulated permease PerM
MIYRHGELETFTKKALVVVALAIALSLLWFTRRILILVFIAAVLAAGISPVVHRVRVVGRRFLHRNMPRGTAILIVFFPFLILVVFLGITIVPRVISDTHALSAQLPTLLARLLPPRVHEYLRGVVVQRSSVFIFVRGAASAIASVAAILFMVVYMLIDAHRLRNMILLLYPENVRGERRRVMKRIARRMTAWLSGQLVLCGVFGIATFIGLIVLRIPYALPLALLATIGELVPVIGPIMAAIPALAIAILQSRWQFWSVLAIALVLQKIENFFIAPRVMARKLRISPLSVFIAFMIGGSLLGIAGAIMAIPVAAILQVTFDEVFVKRRERRQDVMRAGVLVRRRE